jgi:nitroreductase
MYHPRVFEHDIDPLFISRWSPRAFTDATISEAELFRFFEAARWAPSSYNAQPWRFIYALKDSAHWAGFLDFLLPFNREWAQHAAALIVVVSKSTFTLPNKAEPSPLSSHAFDTGAAWASLALQASLTGWHTHALGGFDHDKARAILGVPEGYHLEAVVAVGKRGDKAGLSPELQAREQPSLRRPLSELVAAGQFGF